MRESRHSSSLNRDDDAKLDELLRTASWPDPGPQPLTRLRDQWHRHWRRRNSARWLPLVAAAMLMVAASIALWATNRNSMVHRGDAPAKFAPQVSERSTESRSSESKSSVPQESGVSQAPLKTPRKPIQAEDQEAPTRHAGIEVREPTPLELLVVASRRTRRASSRRSMRVQSSPAVARDVEESSPVEQKGQLLDAALAKLTKAVGADDVDRLMTLADELADELLSDASWHERELWHRIDTSDDERRIAAVWLLANLATEDSLPRLRKLYERAETQSAAVAGLARLDRTENLAWLVEMTDNPADKQRLLANLLARGDGVAMEYFLQYVQRPETQSLAVSAVRLVEQPPVEALFPLLHDPRGSVRLRAAVVLGQIDDSTVARRLMGLVLDRRDSQVALAALLCSNEPAAEAFVQRAREDLYLVALVRSAQYSLETNSLNLWRLPQ